MKKILNAILLTAAVALLPLVHAAEQNAPATAKRTSPVKTGELAPDFTLTDQSGQRHTLSAERGKRAVVLVFYRGYW